jgi:hypothetical protein
MTTNFDIDSDSSQREFVPVSCQHLYSIFDQGATSNTWIPFGDFEYTIIIRVYYEFKDFGSAKDNQWFCSSGVIDA